MSTDLSTDAAGAAAEPAAMTKDELLARVHRDLVGIHASMVEATRDDTATLPWATREIMDVIRYISAARRLPRSAEPPEVAPNANHDG